MNLNEDDIYNSLESYRNKMGYSQEKMAELVGLATKQTYANMIKNKTMKFSYFINLINNTGMSSDYFLNLSTRKEQQEQKEEVKSLNIPGTTPVNVKTYGVANPTYKGTGHQDIVTDPKMTFYTCPECIAKQKEIDALKIAIEALKESNQLLHFVMGKKDRESASG